MYFVNLLYKANVLMHFGCYLLFDAVCMYECVSECVCV